jgi:hypothetical protein
MSTEPSDFPVTNSAPRALLIEQARQWATKALAQASSIKGADRNEECDMGCAVATHNLGEFFEMEGKIQEDGLCGWANGGEGWTDEAEGNGKERNMNDT